MRRSSPRDKERSLGDNQLFASRKDMRNPQTNFVCGFLYEYICDILVLNLGGVEEGEMPEISLFYGIRVTMYYDDHNPPHFHVEYNGYKAIIGIDEARVLK